MGTETLKRPKENDRISTGNTVKLNNPLMGTETLSYLFHNSHIYL